MESDGHLKVPIDALFFTRLSGVLCSEAGKAKMAGKDEAAAVLVGISNALVETFIELGAEGAVQKPYDPNDDI